MFGLVVGANRINNENFIIKRKPDQENLGKGLEKGELRQVPNDVGHITTNCNSPQYRQQGLGACSIDRDRMGRNNTHRFQGGPSVQRLCADFEGDYYKTGCEA